MNIIYSSPKRKIWIAYLLLAILIGTITIVILLSGIDFSNMTIDPNAPQDEVIEQPPKDEIVDPPIEITPQQRAFNELIDKIEILESLASSTDYLLAYIRSAEYNSSAWNTLLDSESSSLVTKVKKYDQENGTSVASLKNSSSKYFIIPSTGEQVDLFHMFAAMEGYLTGVTKGTPFIVTLTGWGGDIFQLAGTGNPSSFNTQNSAFGPADLCADFDAVNIIARYNKNKSKPLYQHIKEYYEEVTTKLRAKEFKNNIFYGTSDSMEDIANFETAIFNRLKTDATCDTLKLGEYFGYGFSHIFGYKFNDKQSMIKQCVHEMAYYILTEINKVE